MRQKLAIKSSFIGIIAQAVNIVLSFISVRYFVRYIGLEAQGLNGVIGNMLGLLQLSELGIGTAITYALYQPVVDRNEKEIAIVMQMFRKAYWIIGTIILTTGVILSFWIDAFVKTTVYSKSYVLGAYYILLISTGSTYFMAYKRNLLYADQKQYITTLIDMCFSVICNVLKLVIIISFKSYLLYLSVSIIQAIGSNIVVTIVCNKYYPFIKKHVDGKYEKMDELKKNMKDLLIGRFGGFVYSSTDNLIVSFFSGVSAVGLLTNYKTLLTILKQLDGSVTGPIQPMIGNYIREYKDTKKSYDLFQAYTYICFFMASILTVGFIVTADAVIVLWLQGTKYLLPMSIVVLLSIDMYIDLLQAPNVNFISVLGYFKYDKYMSILGAGINLVTSIEFSKYFGIAGVLIGTAITQIFYWTFRAAVVFKDYFKKGAVEYVVRNICYVLVVCLEVAGLRAVRELIWGNILRFYALFLMGTMCIVGCILINTLIFGRTEEHKFMVSMIKNIIPRRFQKKKQ